MYVFVSVSSSRCGIFHYAISYTSSSRCRRLGAVLSSRCGVVVLVQCLPLYDFLHVFVSVLSFWCGVFLYAISYTSLSRLFLLRRFPIRLSYGLLVVSSCGVFVWVSSATAISYTSLPGCISLRRSPTCLRLGVFRYGDLLHIFCDYLTKGDQLF